MELEIIEEKQVKEKKSFSREMSFKIIYRLRYFKDILRYRLQISLSYRLRYFYVSDHLDHLRKIIYPFHFC